MQYRVHCDCGATLPVAAGAAGTRVSCKCGREVAVPSLVVLKREAGESAASPELLIEHQLAQGELPEENHCVVCKNATDYTAYFWVVCERAEIQSRSDWSVSPLSVLALFSGWLFFRRSTENRMVGRDISYELPLRVCPSCSITLGRPAAMKEALAQVPVYRRLLEKYGEAGVSRIQRENKKRD